MTHYKIVNFNGDLLAEQLIGTQRDAIKYARTIAAELQHSVEVIKPIGNKEIPICICEFPYYLRAIGKLTWRDIYVNRIG